MSEMVLENSEIVVVVDPAQDRPIALERVIRTSEFIRDRTHMDPVVHVLLAVDMDNTDTSCDNPRIIRDADWFSREVADRLVASKLKYTLQMSWCTDWYRAIRKVASEYQVGGIMLPISGKPRSGRLFSEPIWHLLRTASSPVTIVQPNRPAHRKTVLAAVNFQSHQEEYQRLNTRIVEVASWIAANYGAQFHLVNAYEDSLHYPDRSQLARTGIDPANIHVYAGNADDVIAKVAKEIDSDLLVIGTRSRPSRWRGATAERIIGRVDCDITTVSS